MPETCAVQYAWTDGYDTWHSEAPAVVSDGGVSNGASGSTAGGLPPARSLSQVALLVAFDCS